MRDDLSKTERFVAMSKGRHVNDPGRDPHDFHPTPAPATRAVLTVEKFTGAILEPAAGEGHLSEELIAAGYQVRSTDLIDRGYCEAGVDFLETTTIAEPNVVTNPPFRHLVPFVKKACCLATGKVVMLLRTGALAGLERRILFQKTGLARVWVISNRINFDRTPGARNQGGVIDFAWFVWDRTVPPSPFVQVGFLVADVPLTRRRVRFD